MGWTRWGAAAFALFALLPGGARAEYGQFGPVADKYVIASGSTTICQQGTCTNGTSYNYNLPFTFQHYGVNYTSVTFSGNGMLLFGGGSATSAAAAIPSPGAPNAFIAPWWGGLRASTSYNMRYIVQGKAPTRRVVFEWSGFIGASDNPNGATYINNAQVMLYETTNKIEMRYLRSGAGANVGFASAVGIESGDGQSGIAAIGCSATATCASADFPDGQMIRFTPGKDVAVDSLQITNGAVCQTTDGAPCAYADSDATITAKLRDLGGDSFAGVRVSYYLSQDGFFDQDDVLLGETGASGTVTNKSTSDVAGTAHFPDWPGGQYYLIAVADSRNAVPDETDKLNNVFVNPVPVTMRLPGPDLIVTGFSNVPTKLTHGDNTISLTIKNAGILTVVDPKVAVVLSSNTVVSMQDVNVFNNPLIALGTLAPGESKTVSVKLFVPLGMPNDSDPDNELPDEPYYLGVVIDPDGDVPETDELDNTFTYEKTVKVGGGPLSIVSDKLPDGGLGSPYGAQLLIAGGNGVLAWSVTGAPGGLDVDGNGFFSGSPGNTGTFMVNVTVTDCQGPPSPSCVPQSASKTLELKVESGRIPLRVVTNALPQAAFGVFYEAQLRAVGGCGPYTWTPLAQTVLPPGLTITPGGLLTGTPHQAGTDIEVAVAVADSCNNADTLDTTLTVSPPPQVTIAELELTPASVGKNYTAQLLAAGGVATVRTDYTWAVVQTVRLPSAKGDTAKFFDIGEAPPGLTVLPDGTVTGEPTLAGQYLMKVGVKDSATPAPGSDEATILVTVLYDAGMSIVTLSLPDAYIGVDYHASIVANGGVGDVEWSLLPGSNLPQGLGLEKPTGHITGQPGEGAIESGENFQDWAFFVMVKDSQGRSAQGVVAIHVGAKEPKQPVKTSETKTGCGSNSAAAGSVSGLAMVVAAALLRRRKR